MTARIRSALILFAVFGFALLFAGGCTLANLPTPGFARAAQHSIYHMTPDEYGAGTDGDDFRFSGKPEFEQPLPPEPADESFGALKRWASVTDPAAPWAGLRKLFRGTK